MTAIVVAQTRIQHGNCIIKDVMNVFYQQQQKEMSMSSFCELFENKGKIRIDLEGKNLLKTLSKNILLCG